MYSFKSECSVKKKKKKVIQYNTIQNTIQNGNAINLFPLERFHGQEYKVDNYTQPLSVLFR